MPVARRLLLLVVALSLLVGCGADRGEPAGPRPVAATSAVAVEPEEPRPTVRALAVLRRWDRLRAAAYASGEPAALRRLYSPGSWAGASDVRTLREYAERGLVVRGLRMQVLEAEVLPAAPGTLRLRVVERLAGGVVVADGSRAALPAGRATPRVITLVDVGPRWVVRSVRRG